jgi:hypothetical protein
VTAYDELISETARAADDRAPEILAPADVADEPQPLLATASSPKKNLTSVAFGRLVAVLTTQSVIVTVLAALTAVTVAADAARIINAKLGLIVTALKRL